MDEVWADLAEEKAAHLTKSMSIPLPVRVAGQRQAAEQLTDNEDSSHNFLNSEAASEKSFIRSWRLLKAVEPHSSCFQYQEGIHAQQDKLMAKVHQFC